MCERALFVLDKDGKVFWSYRSPIAVNPGADGILDALERISQRTGEQMPREARQPDAIPQPSENSTMAMLRVPVGPDDHLRGNPNSPVTLVEYGDFECPHCGAAHPIVIAVEEHFGDDLCFAFRHFPLTQIHPNAEPAAEASEYAGSYGRFCEMHDAIYENQDQLGLPLLFAIVEALGLSQQGLRDTLARRQYVPRVQRDFMGGVCSGVNGTPTFFINGRRHDEPFAYEYLVSAIEAELMHA